MTEHKVHSDIPLLNQIKGLGLEGNILMLDGICITNEQSPRSLHIIDGTILDAIKPTDIGTFNQYTL
jgi:hypothetical protein